MKTNHSFANNSRSKLLIFSFIFTLVFCFSTFAQNASVKSDVRVRYISSAPKKRAVRKKSPGIRFVKTAKSTKGKKLFNLKPTDFTLERKAFDLINKRREERGLAKLIWNAKVAELARVHSQNMARHSFFSHVGLNGRMIDQRANDFGLSKWRSIGENIAFSKGFSNPAEFAVKRWMLSDGHRRNLLHTMWTESGIGMARTEDGKYFLTQVFMVK